MTRISSAANPRLRSLRRLHTRAGRARSGAFLAEGEDLIEAAASAGRAPLEGFRLAGSGLGGAAFHDVEPAALRAASALGSGSRVIGVFEQRWGAPAGPLCVYLHAVADPGNVGAVLRSAEAFGAACVALGPGCADPHSPKAVRASMGAIFTVALARVADVRELPGERIALSTDAPRLLGDLQLARGERSVLIGSERHGLPDEIVSACEHRARIAIASHSLNAAMAATVALYELARPVAGERRSSRVRA